MDDSLGTSQLEDIGALVPWPELPLLYIHTYMHAYIHAYIHIYIHTYMHAYMHAYIYIYTYIYIFAPLSHRYHSYNSDPPSVDTS